MLKVDRHNKIMEMLQIKGNVLVSDLSLRFDCSDETIRRDLKELEDSNLLTRTHGGAFLSEKHDKGYPSGIRKVLLAEEKIRISREALSFIKNNDFLFLDSSTTCLQLAREIIDAGLSVSIVTNSLLIANLCTEERNDIDLVLLGGVLRKTSQSTNGYESLIQLQNYHADKCFLSPPKISKEIGLTDNHIYEGKVREAMIKKSDEVILLLDHTKFYDNENFVISNLDDIDIIITDKQLDDNWKKYTEKNKDIDFIIANDL